MTDDTVQTTDVLKIYDGNRKLQQQRVQCYANIDVDVDVDENNQQ